MRRFKFGLEKVLRIREMATMRAKEALAQAEFARNRAATSLAEATRAKEAFAARLQERRSRGMAAWEWVQSSQQHVALRLSEQAAQEGLQAAIAEVAARREALTVARQAEEALQKLRERQREAFIYAEEQAEQAAIDEMAQMMRRLHKEVG